MAGYRPVSRLAVASACVGVVAALAVVSPVFWALPMIGIGLAVAALRETSRSEAVPVGRLVAVAGLALSVGFGTQAVVAAGVTRWAQAGRAEAAARQWIETICAGRRRDARGMCGPAAADAIDACERCCAQGVPRLRGRGPAEEPATWRVSGAVGDCELEMTLSVTATTITGRPAERWTVVSAAITGP